MADTIPRAKRVTKRLRFEILNRDGFRCRYCGLKAGEAELVVDHVIPTALGGDTLPSNLVTACRPCNEGKSSMNPDAATVEDVAEDAIHFGRVLQLYAEYRQGDIDGIAQAFDAAWTRWQVNGREVPRPATWRVTAVQLVDAGLDPDEFDFLVETAIAKSYVAPEDKFVYFCGVGWNVLRDRVASARRQFA